VSFHNIARDFRRVAGSEIVWNAELSLHRIEVSGFQDVRAKAGLPQVLHPTRTAAAIRVQMDGDDLFFRGERTAFPVRPIAVPTARCST
jgi:hypothetical protein